MKKNVFILSLMLLTGVVNAQDWPSIISRLNDASLTPASKQEPLPYAYDALEPYIDARTMEIHYTKHHAAYTSNMNDAVKDSETASLSLLDIFNQMSKYPVGLRNNAGGFYNHLVFWKMMKPNGGGKPEGKLLEAIISDFGSFESFVKNFSSAAAKRFGSGWAWLSLDADGKLFVSSTPNQDNPLMDVAEKRGIPLLGLDVWEHAYYLNYQNRRAEYIQNFWQVVNWDEVSARYEEARKAIGK
ncbi:MAG: superoxide dismutase, Fe-Mn family [Bacteroidales bacterium]|nr:superoxide dismutase, Fe-Mn family [Bacteroidales bacterium]MDN5328687.1 superoxide dismutase, Fe-Mn family [Bacteroidales bacterium]